MKKTYLLFLLFYTLFYSNQVFAHPHVFINADIKFVYKDKQLVATNNIWVFDEMFSLDIIENYDKDGNKEFSKEELSQLKQEAFDNLKNYGYFNFLYVNDKKIEPLECKNFKAYITKENQLKYSFSLSFPKTKIKDNKLVFSVNDPEFFIAFEYKDKKISAGKKCKLELKEDKEHPIYMDMVYPMSFFIKCE